jgi:hypothetical protein
MSDPCISGRHPYEHLGTSCDEMDEQLRVMREVALSGTSITSEKRTRSASGTTGTSRLERLTLERLGIEDQA